MKEDFLSDFSDLLRIYYKFLFPYKLFYKWLSYGQVETDYFNRREFSFTLEGDIYIRYLSFNNVEELRSSIIQNNPIKIDIGAVYNIFPKESKSQITLFQALERELIFDIDLTDYDDVRSCCSNANICNKCWKFMVIAVKILNRVLREDFGFKNIFFVYSGRRGIHCWVLDERARKLSFEARSSIVDYLTLIEGGEFKDKKVSLNSNKNLHPSIVYALEIIEDYFLDMLVDQKWLEGKEKIQHILSLCNNNIKNEMMDKFLDSKSKPKKLWKEIETFFKSKVDNNQDYFIEEVKIQLCYPRLDINVSKSINHLLKSPFCVHPKTGRICIPIDLKDIDVFDPLKVPHLKQLSDEIDSYEYEKDKRVKLEEYDKTSLKSSINFFKIILNDLYKENRQIKLKKNDESMSF